jgi:hypothetical protein
MIQANATFSADDLAAIANSLQTIRQNMPFLVALSATEKQRLTKIGTKAQTFVDKSLTVAEQHPTLIPQSLNIEAARQKLTLFSALNAISQELKTLNELVECTQMLAGSEAYASARLAYRSVKVIGKTHGLEPVVEDLSRQFRRVRQQVKPPVVGEEGPTASS